MKDQRKSAEEALRNELYIPHGSDESLTLILWTSAIAHLYIPHGSDESSKSDILTEKLTETLYPTWFRWKIRHLSR